MTGGRRTLAFLLILGIMGLLSISSANFGRSAFAAGAVDLRITKYANVDEVVAGETVLYTVSIYNASNGTNDDATGVVVTDLMPVGVTYLGDTNPGGSCSAPLDGSADIPVTTTATTLSDTRLAMTVNAHVGKTIAAGGKTLVVTSNTATTFTGASWSGGGTPGDGIAWRMLDVPCAVGTIPAFQSVSFNIKVRVDPDFVAKTTTGTATLVNTVSVTSDAGDSNSADNTATSRILVGERADLRITKFIQPVDETNSGGDGEGGGAIGGATVVYTIYVDNYGPSAARNVAIFDTLLSSDDVQIQSCAFSVSQGGGSITQFTCTTGSLVTTQFGSDIGTFRTSYLMPLSADSASNGRLRASFRMVMNDSGTITNSTRVASDTYDPNTADNFSSIDLTVNPVIDLQAFSVFGAEVQTNGLPGTSLNTNVVTAMPDPACCNFGGTTVTAGRRLQFDTSVTNAGPANAHNVAIEVSLPFGASLIENTLTGIPTPGLATGRCITESAGQLRTKVICRYGTLYSPAEITLNSLPAGSGAASLRFLVLVDPSLPPGTQLSFDTDSYADEPELNTSNNITGIQFDTNAWADLSIVKNPLGPDPWLAGGTRTIRYDVASKGPSLASDVVISDPLPAGLSFVGAYLGADAGDGGVPFPCVVDSTNHMECKLGDIAPSDGTKKVFVQVKVGPEVPDGTILSSTSTVGADTPDPFASDNSSAGAGKTVSASADLKVEVKATVLEGGILGFFAFAKRTVNHEITVTNLGSSEAQDVELVINLPVSPYGKYAVAVIGGCTQVDLVLTCDLGAMAAGSSKTFVVQFQMGALKGTVSLSAEVSASTPDPVLDNNEFESMVIFGSSGWSYHY